MQPQKQEFILPTKYSIRPDYCRPKGDIIQPHLLKSVPKKTKQQLEESKNSVYQNVRAQTEMSEETEEFENRTFNYPMQNSLMQRSVLCNISNHKSKDFDGFDYILILENKSIPLIQQFKKKTNLMGTQRKHETSLKEKDGQLYKRSNLNKPFKKYNAILKNSTFQLFDINNKSNMKLTLRLDQAVCKIEIVKDSIKISILGSSKILYLSHDSKNFLKEWFLVFQHQQKTSTLNKHFHQLQIKENFHKYHYITISEFEKSAQNLDILLFKSLAIGAQLQRAITGSEYDHVAMVLKTCLGEIYIFEANSDNGVGLWNWKKFQTFDWKNTFEKVVYRKIQTDRTLEMIETLQTFVRESLGKKYQLSLTKLFKKKSLMNAEFLLQKDEHRTFFCSELVAASLKIVKLLPIDISSTQYWPKDFAQSKNLPLLNNSQISHEMIIDLTSI